MCEHRQELSQIFDEGNFPEDAFYLNKVFNDRKIILYGAGEAFAWFNKIVVIKHGFIPSLILDRKFGEDDTFEGIPACSPFKFKPSSEDQENAIVVICLGNVTFLEESYQLLKSMGFKNVISLMEIYEVHNPFSLPEELDKEGFKFYLKNRKKIEFCLDLFVDDQSKEVYVKFLRTHLQRKPVRIPMCERAEQYTPQDISLAKGYSNFIYCGVSPGEIPMIFNRIGKIDNLFCIEANPNKFRLASEYLRNHANEIADRITIIPCAVHNREAIEPFIFSNYTSFGNRIHYSGKYFIQSVTIDNIIPEFRPTFISMDIEGSELDAIKGARKTIEKSLPDLGICVYHSPEHIWDIPLYLHSLGHGYRFYLRNYTSFIHETVLYATS